MTSPVPPCGTTAGYQRHLRNGETADRACLDAVSEYQRNYRQANPRYKVRARRRDVIRQRAMRRLAREYPARYLQLLDEENDYQEGDPR